MTLSVLIFLISFFGLYIWNFQVIYNHWLIKNFTFRNRFEKSKINQIIADLNRKYYTNVVALNLESVQEEYDLKETRYESSVAGTSDLVVKVLFCTTISLSIELIILILCELIEISASTSTIFHLLIDSLVIIVTGILPLIVISLIILGKLGTSKPDTFQIIKIVGTLIVWFFFLSRFGIYSDRTVDNSQSNKTLFIDKKVGEILILGVTTISILLGIGSTSTIYNLIVKFNKAQKHEIREIDLNKLIQSYNNTGMLIRKRQANLDDYLVKSGGTIYNSKLGVNYELQLNNPSKKNRLGGLLHKVQSFATLSSYVGEEMELTQEIKSLKNLNENIYNEVNNKLALFFNQKTSDASKFDKLLKAFDYAFTLYCIYRVLNVFIIKLPLYYLYPDNITVSGESLEASNDALAITISKLIRSLVNIEVSEVQLINQISFILSGGLFICSFSNVLMTFKSFGKIFPPIFPQITIEVKNWLQHLIIAQLLAIYVISTCLLIRTNLPTNLSDQISKILSLSGSSSHTNSSKEVEFVDHWFDLGYAISCIVTLLLFLVHSKLEETYDEELFVEDKVYKFL